MKKFTKDQMNFLAKQEPRFSTAIKAQWASYPGADVIDQLREIYDDVTGRRNNINKNCGTCILHLLQDVGRLYYAQIESEKVVKVTIKEKKSKTPKK